MTDEQQAIVLRNQGLIGLIIKKMNYKYNLDEISDIGMLGLCKGAKTYDPNQGFKESSYLTRCIQNEILMYFRKKDNRMSKISLDATYEYNPKLKKLELMEMIPDEKEDIEEKLLSKEQIKELYEKILNLTNREMLVICSTYGLCSFPKLNQKEIAIRLGITQSSVSRIKTKAIKILRKELMNDNKA